jgi:pyruvate/2-oxoglutarate dehydrogenase complex dihydrolipoamide dehydrogenase (E3) component
VDGAADRLVGAHLMTPDAHEIVNLLALAMQNDLPASRLRRAALAFPTGGYDMKSML